ncbi:MAG: hypothetical protein K2Y26_00675 [Gemmatimonadaceae bacterium]|nr:hypothetical protein [Gemmatimonadaceae bacterium]
MFAPSRSSDEHGELFERGCAVFLTECFPGQFKRKSLEFDEESASGNVVMGLFSLNKNGVPSGNDENGARPFGCQKFTSSTSGSVARC